MSVSDSQPVKYTPVGPEKTADVLQATFKHYYDVAMDHHNQAAITSNILLIIVGAIIALIGSDEAVEGLLDGGGAVAVIVLGCFGAVWARKQHERYYYWWTIALEYQKELAKIVPMLKTYDDYEASANQASVKEYRNFFTNIVLVRNLWVFLHIVVVIVGCGLLALSIAH
jgi:hypothetical protein